MNWQQQAQHSAQPWQEAKQHMLNGWGTLLRSGWGNRATSADKPPSGSAWHDIMLHSIRQITSQSDSTAREVAERLFASQVGMLHLLELAINTWQVISPQLESGEAWSITLEQHLQQLRTLMLRTATHGLHVDGSAEQLWQAFLREGQAVLLPWLSALQNIRGALSEDPSGMLNLSSISSDIYQHTSGSALPGMSYNREIDEGLRHSFAAWLEMQQAAYHYNSLLTEVWLTAFERLIRELAALAEHGEMVENVRDFLNRWGATADDVFKQASRSERYIGAQTGLINAIMLYRQRQRHVNEAVMTWIDLPSRTEIDESHRRIYELNKEVKSLRRELAEIKATLQQVIQNGGGK